MEEWKQINDYPNYSISNLGVIKNNKNLIMKLNKIKAGYLNIKLGKDGIRKFFLHHQLMGLHFIPNPENYSQIDHINGVRNDNRLENLRWVNHSQNQRNKKKKTNCSSQYLGVSWCKRDNKWLAKISINKIDKYLGYFDTEIEAFSAWKSFVVQNNLQEFYSQTVFKHSTKDI
jgi:hypothetical protein